MKRTGQVVAAASIALAGLVGIGGGGAYWFFSHQLRPVLDAPELALRPTPIEPRLPPSTRPIDLGYATFNVPAWLAGAPHREQPQGTVEISTGEVGDFRLILSPPVADYAQPTQGTFHGLAHQALSRQPTSLWKILHWDLSLTGHEIELRLMKQSLLTDSASPSLVENDRLGILVTRLPEATALVVTDFGAGTIQQILFIGLTNADHEAELIGALLDSYAIRLFPAEDWVIDAALDSRELALPDLLR